MDDIAVGESIIAVDHHRIPPNPLVNASPISNRRGGTELETPLDCCLIESVEVAHREEVVVQPTPVIFVARQTALPPTLPPRLIGREAAAAYLSVSSTIFDEMVRDGRMPRPKKLGERRLAWDVRAIDRAIDLLPVDGDDTDESTWSDVDDAS